MAGHLVVTGSSDQYISGIPQNCQSWFDGTRYWVFYQEIGALKCRYGTTLASLSDAGSTGVAGIGNNGRHYGIVFGEISGTPYAWCLSDCSASNFGVWRWELTSSGLGTASTEHQTISSNKPGHINLAHDYGGISVAKLYGANNGPSTSNSSIANRETDAGMASNTGGGATDSSAITFPEHTPFLKLSDGFISIHIDQGASGEVNGNYGHLREWTKTNVGDSWSSEGTIEGTFGTSNNGDFADQNYAANTSHAGQQDFCQLDDGTIWCAYIDNDDLTNGDYGIIKVNKRGAAKAGTWSTISTDVIGSSGKAWHLAVTTDGTDMWVFYCKDSSGTRDTAIYYRKYDVSETSWGTEIKLADMQSSHTFLRMSASWRSANGKAVVAWSELGSAVYDLVVEEVDIEVGGSGWVETINEIGTPAAINEITGANIQSVNEI